MSEPSQGISHGSAPVAIILALALAATVGVSAQSWDVKVAARQVYGAGKQGAEQGAEAGAAASPGESDDVSLLRLVVDWATHGRRTNCASPPR